MKALAQAVLLDEHACVPAEALFDGSLALHRLFSISLLDAKCQTILLITLGHLSYKNFQLFFLHLLMSFQFLRLAVLNHEF